MGQHNPLREFDLFAPEPFLVIPPLPGAARSRAVHNGGQGPEAPAPICDPGAGAFLPDASLTALARLRAEQITRYGHTPEADAARPLAGFLDHMLHEAQRYAVAAGDDHRARTGLANIEKRMLRLGAIAVAVLDRLAQEPGA